MGEVTQDAPVEQTRVAPRVTMGALARGSPLRAGAMWQRILVLAVFLATSTTALVILLGGAIWSIFFLSFTGALLTGLIGASRQAKADAARVEAFGQYRLVRKVGEGGMGVVYEASHAFLRRPTALKLLRPLPDEDPGARAEALQRFEREAQLTSQLNHPNTIVIYDYGRSAEGRFYFAMEFIDGIDLERLVRVAGPLAPARVIYLALQVCGSLAEAHGKALIHRDIKPANLFVYERAGMFDTVKVMDFGLVKSLHGPIVSAAHVLIGTPLYMAPEVLQDPSRASPRSDIYALGAVLHWLATGKTLAEAALLGAANPLLQLPIDLERVILRCTEADPYDRPESMEQVASELTACRDYGQWTQRDAAEYWQAHGKRLSTILSQPAAPNAKTLVASG